MTLVPHKYQNATKPTKKNHRQKHITSFVSLDSKCCFYLIRSLLFCILLCLFHQHVFWCVCVCVCLSALIVSFCQNRQPRRTNKISDMAQNDFSDSNQHVKWPWTSNTKYVRLSENNRMRSLIFTVTLHSFMTNMKLILELLKFRMTLFKSSSSIEIDRRNTVNYFRKVSSISFYWSKVFICTSKEVLHQ